MTFQVVMMIAIFIEISEKIFAVKLRLVVVMMFSGVEKGVIWLDKWQSLHALTDQSRSRTRV